MARTNEFKLTGEVRSPAKTMGPRALRTSGLIKECAREVFLAKGYFGTSVEEIAEAAGVSRASFYTYFPSKRDLLYSLGTDTYEALSARSTRSRALDPTWTDDDVYEIVRIYLRFLERARRVHARVEPGHLRRRRARQDRDAHPAGERASVRSDAPAALGRGCRIPTTTPARFGLAILVMIDRYWSYWRVNDFPFSEDEVVETLGDVLGAFISVASPATRAQVQVHSGSRFSRYERRASAESW